MCGIAGIISANNALTNYIEDLTNIVQHRGPDGAGVYKDEQVAFGHRRLSILDLSELGKQPMHYLDRYVITYNGEVYNYIEIREVLEKGGYNFVSHSDTEVIVAAYAEWGEKCLEKLNGMFSFAIHDRKLNTVFCARDRFGVKPFYYYANKEAFVFGSEIKQFTVLPYWEAVLNERKVVDFLVNDIIDRDEETFFQGVKQLRGGHFLKYNLDDHTFEIKSWYHLEKKDEYAGLNETAAIEKFRELFTDAVKLRLRSDVKIGSCLSGGLDSSSIVSVVNELLKEEGKTDLQEVVSACFENKKYDEQQYIDTIVKEKSIKGHKIFPDVDDLFPELDKLLWHQDEPFGSTSIFAQWNVFRESRKAGLIVMLDGQGADEILGGYHTYYGPYILSAWKKGNIATAFKRMRWVNGRGYGYKWIIKEVYKNAISTGKKVKLQNIREKRFSYIKEDLQEKYLENVSYNCFKGMSYQQIRHTNLPMLLHFEDRDSMAFSVESRVPFLDYRLVELCYSVDEDILLKQGTTKHILREAMKDLLPPAIKNRMDKMGFVTPEKVWLKTHREIFLQELNEAVKSLNGLINENIISLFNDIVEDKIAFDFTPWKVVVLGRWIRLFKVKII
ncbi:asparagine synthase (glutamine-hydrolyzing) [Chitinophaga sp. Cy-1792]|uniref:asparagine synthase (glutamine-hydrolyzing) n=1 Tax=Chitinophaga sp. Cy-1792 TaxID=2608339 RepID=UPI0021058954|nr:asparagine synthase (glutamine-hydrolyzing) [Chitinophaga sp. Cy-1792]NIG52090.1 asparagine synthase (glutamine-hydrolyzing) [Chitinophaga sp. Cy-1792]